MDVKRNLAFVGLLIVLTSAYADEHPACGPLSPVARAYFLEARAAYRTAAYAMTTNSVIHRYSKEDPYGPDSHYDWPDATRAKAADEPVVWGLRGRFKDRFNNYPGATVSERVANACQTTFGLTKGEIASIRRILIGETLKVAISSTPLWPSGKAPYFQPHQTAEPRLEWLGPEKPATDACLLPVPGGAYETCEPSKWLDIVAARYMERGITCYRLIYRTPRPKGIPIWKTACADGQRAVRLLRTQAKERGFDPEKIAAFGFSAGGNLVLTLATSSQTPLYELVDSLDAVSCHLNRAIPVYAAYTLTDGLAGPNERRGEGPDVQLLDRFSFDAKTPPICLFHGGGCLGVARIGIGA